MAVRPRATTDSSRTEMRVQAFPQAPRIQSAPRSDASQLFKGAARIRSLVQALVRVLATGKAERFGNELGVVDHLHAANLLLRRQVAVA